MERELKLVGRDEAAFAAIATVPCLDAVLGEERTLRATYYDTETSHLRRAGLSLRVRYDGVAHVQTVKAEGGASAGLFARPEWERAIAGEAPIVDAAAGPIAAIIGDRPLQPRFTTDIRRRTGLIIWEGARIEAALDRGMVMAGGAADPVAELELELKQGAVPALFALARHLAAAVPLRLGVQTKSGRGHDLADGIASRAAVKAEPVRLDRQGTVADAFAAIAGDCLRQFRLNEDRLLAREDNAAALHQARVALRRLRSAFSLFKPLLVDGGQARLFAAALKEWAAVLGDVRDLDVVSASVDETLHAPLAAARAEASGRARTMLEAGDTRARLLDLVEWLAVGDWRLRPADPALASGPIRPFAAERLDRARKRVKGRGAHLARLDDEARHAVRIEGKKLRYATEFFATLWPGKEARQRAKRFAGAVETLQDELGRLNDRAHGPAVLARLGLPAPPLAPIGRKKRKCVEDAWDAVIGAKRFWR